MQRFALWMVLLAAGGAVWAQGITKPGTDTPPPQAPPVAVNCEVPLSGQKVVDNGLYAWNRERVAIGGENYADYVGFDGPFEVTFDIRGWDYFIAYVGCVDDSEQARVQMREYAAISVDGAAVWTRNNLGCGPAEPVCIALTGHQTLKLESGMGIAIFALPRLGKGPMPVLEPPQQSALVAAKTPGQQQGAHTAPFRLRYDDVKSLADAIFSVRARSGFDGGLAMPTFSLVDLPYPGLATSVSDDLVVAMYEKASNSYASWVRFPLRGSVDALVRAQQVASPGELSPAQIAEMLRSTRCNTLVLGTLADAGDKVVASLLFVNADGNIFAVLRRELQKVPLAQ